MFHDVEKVIQHSPFTCQRFFDHRTEMSRCFCIRFSNAQFLTQPNQIGFSLQLQEQEKKNKGLANQYCK